MVKPKSDQSDEVSPATSRLSAIADEAQLDTSTLSGDLRDVVLDIIKSRPKPWSQMVEAEQQDVVRAIEYACDKLVVDATDLIRTAGQENPVRAILESYTEKDGIKVALKVKTAGEADGLAAIQTLHKARGKLVLVTLATADDYRGQRGEAPIDTDQQDLGFEAGSDDDAGADLGDQQQEGDNSGAPANEG